MGYLYESFNDFLNENKFKKGDFVVIGAPHFIDDIQMSSGILLNYDDVYKIDKVKGPKLVLKGDNNDTFEVDNKYFILNEKFINENELNSLLETYLTSEDRGFTNKELRLNVMPILKKIGIKAPNDSDIDFLLEPLKELIKDKKLGILLESNINEARLQYKRKYTESYPAKTFNSSTKIRTKILETIADGVITEKELLRVLKELKANQRWYSRNKDLFKITENGVCLSTKGKRMSKHIISKTLNESSFMDKNPFDKDKLIQLNNAGIVDEIITKYNIILSAKEKFRVQYVIDDKVAIIPYDFVECIELPATYFKLVEKE